MHWYWIEVFNKDGSLFWWKRVIKNISSLYISVQQNKKLIDFLDKYLVELLNRKIINEEIKQKWRKFMNDLDMRVNIAKNLRNCWQFADGPSAIWEYTSNSLEYRESPLNCKIDIQIDKNQIIISDNSDGMDQEILKYFFTVWRESSKKR